MWSLQIFLLSALLAAVQPAAAFVASPMTKSSISRVAVPTDSAVLPPLKPTVPTALGMINFKEEKRDVDGFSDGLVIMGIVLALNVWIFSIPPEFRRAKVCPDLPTTQSLINSGQCITADAWKDGIAEYYKNGGGVHFDFSIEGRE